MDIDLGLGSVFCAFVCG